MQFLVTFGCDFITTGDGSQIGVWYIDDGSGTCVEWPDSREEIVAGAQSALTLSTIAGFAAGFLVLFEWLCCEICCAGCVEGLAFCGAWMLGGSVFMIYGTLQTTNWALDLIYVSVVVRKRIRRMAAYSIF